ncbi:MAG: nucleoside triphosphate pyrophosphohydrolase [bacterium]|nr:nucleoside triphosphate pyrophosphohydrolase [bacterium]
MEQPRIVYNKLVRDKIPDIIRSHGRHPEMRILSDDEYRKFLRLKLVEEAGENQCGKGTGRFRERMRRCARGV